MTITGVQDLAREGIDERQFRLGFRLVSSPACRISGAKGSTSGSSGSVSESCFERQYEIEGRHAEL